MIVKFSIWIKLRWTEKIVSVNLLMNHKWHCFLIYLKLWILQCHFNTFGQHQSPCRQYSELMYCVFSRAPQLQYDDDHKHHREYGDYHYDLRDHHYNDQCHYTATSTTSTMTTMSRCHAAVFIDALTGTLTHAPSSGTFCAPHDACAQLWYFLRVNVLYIDVSSIQLFVSSKF